MWRSAAAIASGGTVQQLARLGTGFGVPRGRPAQGGVDVALHPLEVLALRPSRHTWRCAPRCRTLRAPTATRASRSQTAGLHPARGTGAPSAMSWASVYWWPCSWRRIFCAVRSETRAFADSCSGRPLNPRVVPWWVQERGRVRPCLQGMRARTRRTLRGLYRLLARPVTLRLSWSTSACRSPSRLVSSVSPAPSLPEPPWHSRHGPSLRTECQECVLPSRPCRLSQGFGR